MKLTKETLAAQLNGREYLEEITDAEDLAAHDAGLVVVFGYSDDNTEFKGAIDDELGCYDGGEFYLHRGGILTDPSNGDCEHCGERAEKQQKHCAELKALWGVGGYSWQIEMASVPHATFDIVEDGEKFCRGIVFSIDDLPTLNP